MCHIFICYNSINEIIQLLAVAVNELTYKFITDYMKWLYGVYHDALKLQSGLVIPRLIITRYWFKFIFSNVPTASKQ